MNNPKTVPLEEAEWLEMHPTFFRPVTDAERLAALVGYMVGDGAIALRSAKYTRKDGSVSTYAPVTTGAFYSNDKADLDQILEDLIALGIVTERTSVTLKKTPAHLDDGYQLQLSSRGCQKMVDAGVPVGKKTMQTFEIPEWIKRGDPSVKRAFLSALFGAEATTPTSTKGGVRTMRPIVMAMYKIAPVEAGGFFEGVQVMLAELGVTASVTTQTGQRYGKIYDAYLVRVSGLDNIIAFLGDVGYVYCQKKALAGWQWLQYLRAYRKRASDRRETVLRMRAQGCTYDAIGSAIGLTKGAAFRLLKDIQIGASNTAGHDFPEFAEWMSSRWVAQLGVLRLKVVGRTARPGHAEVWNLLVSSPDHSYLLANGVNNFNSFETMSGRVYYAFDRRIHVKPCPFNPALPIWVGQDFNLDPMSSIILQPQPSGEVWAVGEISLNGSNTEEVASELERQFFRYQKNVTIFPDPAGNYGQHARGETDLDIFREKGFKKIRHRRKHPLISDRVNAVNRMFKSADGTIRFYMDPSCEKAIESVEQTIYKPESRDVDKSMNIEHMGDAIGYPMELLFPIHRPVIGGMSR